MDLIPKTKSGVNRSLKDLTICIFGPPKIGKSSFCAKFPNNLFIDLNSGLGGLDVLKTPILTTWEEMLQLEKELANPENRKKIDTITIDTLGEMYDLCLTYVCNKVGGYEHPSDVNDFGKTWGLVTKELDRYITSLGKMGYGRILISHVKETEAPPPVKMRYTPDLGGKALAKILSKSNLILYFRKETRKLVNPETKEVRTSEVRVIRTRETVFYSGGCHEVDGRILKDPIPLNFEEFMKELNILLYGEGGDKNGLVSL